MPDPAERSDSTELPIGSMAGEYRIEGKLGRGGMGTVYAAVHPVIGKRAAIKVLHREMSIDAEAVDRFIQEARAVNQIGHPNIVDIFGFGVLPDGRHYFAMERLRGESLRDRLRRGALPLVDTLAILDAITIALEAAHEKGIVHRDLKPDNVFLVETKGGSQVKLLDFGIAKLLGAQQGTTRTQTGHMLGTPAYVSPEQARAQAVDHRTDIYALGAVAFELCTGQFVFEADNAADMIAKQLFQPPRSAAALAPAVPPALDALITQMLAKEADARPTLEQARAAIRTCQLELDRLVPPGRAQSAPGGLVASAPGFVPTPPRAMTPPTGVPITPPAGVPITAPRPASSPGVTTQSAPGGVARSRIAVIAITALAVVVLGVWLLSRGGSEVEPARPAGSGGSGSSALGGALPDAAVITAAADAGVDATAAPRDARLDAAPVDAPPRKTKRPHDTTTKHTAVPEGPGSNHPSPERGSDDPDAPM